MIQTSHGLYKTVCVSYPRSGQSLLKPVLSDYFGDRFKYCEWYDEPEKRPNVCAETNFVKTHDRDLNWHIREDWKYLVLVRHPIASVASWKIMEQEGNYNIGWKLDFWAKWTTRWVIGTIPNRMILSYESLVNDPFPVLHTLIWFLSGDGDNERIKSLIQKHNISPRTNHARNLFNVI